MTIQIIFSQRNYTNCIKLHMEKPLAFHIIMECMSSYKSFHFMNNNLPITFAIYMSLVGRAYIPTQCFSLWARALTSRVYSFTLHPSLSLMEKTNNAVIQIVLSY